jgi:phytanoyl-CoA hydroxylase
MTEARPATASPVDDAPPLKLGTEQIARFKESGYLVVEKVFDPDRDLPPLLDEYASVLDRLASQLMREGKLAQSYAGLDFGERLIRICEATGSTYAQHFNPSLSPHGFRAGTPYWVGPQLLRAMRHPRLLDAVADLIDSDEIHASPIAHVRIKLPEAVLSRLGDEHLAQLGRTAIHQDSAGLPASADPTRMLICWFPVQDVDVHNGCLSVWPGSHRRGLYPHRVVNRKPRIPVRHLRDIGIETSVPMSAGSVLFMDKHMLHASAANNGPAVRWSFDFRY